MRVIRWVWSPLTAMPSAAVALPPPLFEGDRLTTGEFLRRWEVLPDLKYAELIDGVVFLGSPLSLNHGRIHYRLTGWLNAYEMRTPGCEGGNDTTWVMGNDNVLQPDIFLRILPDWGGQSGSTPGGKYGAGAPELIVEVCGSSLSRDLGVKLELYRREGVKEYLTVELTTRSVTWRQLAKDRYREMRPGADGLLRSKAFPGLWLDPKAVWGGDILQALELGLQAPEHAAFAKRLQAAHRCG